MTTPEVPVNGLVVEREDVVGLPQVSCALTERDITI